MCNVYSNEKRWQAGDWALKAGGGGSEEAPLSSVTSAAAAAAAAATALGFASRGVSAAAAAQAWNVQMAG